MPYIETKTSVSVSKDQLTALKGMFAEVIEIIPGKSEEWLMINVSDSQRMAFRGNTADGCAILEVKIFGKTTDAAYDAMTKELCKIASAVTGISPSSIYVKYEECFRWGWNGMNF